MPFEFICACLLALATLGIIGAAMYKPRGERLPWVWGAIAGVFATLIVLFISAANLVPGQAYGLVTVAGQPSGHIGSGFHLLAPWDSVSDWSRQVQSIVYEGKNCLPVRLQGGQSACPNVTVQYQIDPTAIDSEFVNYGSEDGVRDRLVEKVFGSVMNEQFSNFDPIDQALHPKLAGSVNNPTADQVVAAVTEEVQAKVKGKVFITSIFLKKTNYSDQVQARLDSIKSQVADNAKAELAIKQAQSQATAADDLEKSLRNDPGYLQYECLQTEQEAIKADYQMNAAWNCSGSSSVIVPAK